MMMHHSRNTAEKQWAETERFALQGSCRVFKIFFPVLHSLPKFKPFWLTFTQIIVEGMAREHYDVATTGMTNIFKINFFFLPF